MEVCLNITIQIVASPYARYRIRSRNKIRTIKWRIVYRQVPQYRRSAGLLSPKTVLRLGYSA